MGLFNRKSRVEKISLVLDRDSSIYDDYEEKADKKWQKDLDKVFKSMKKNGTPDELKEFLAHRYPFHCWEHGLEDMEEIILNTKEMSVESPKNHSIPTQIGQCQNLEVFYLIQGRLQTIPPEFENLKSLKTLSVVVDNEFPEVISRLTNLQELILTQSNIDKIPKHINKLKKLKKLELNDLHYGTFPLEVCQLPQLSELGLMRNGIQTVPPSISNLKALTKLNLTGNPIQSISPKINQLENLKSLYLRGTNLPKTLKAQLSEWLPNTEIII
ncbi:leucine-rich repeat domain-containing protein [Microscilla marina]|uniref:Leucine-rich repeat containing protein n=1 Tax=Microscilla marina ATCC 23134 TaxID=313606 RepID=A1ZH96_MICM2|nr:leucine-rich repeat domain-containing protein [Microscilla marina]EAY30365.1 leucine-rich repeat containing protein [Microscilla marina ATCC 23134]